MYPFNCSRKFNQLFLAALDEALLVLGDEPVTQAFYYHLKRRAKIDREEIPIRLREFHSALYALFDDGPAILEKRILKNLYESLGLDLPFNDKWTLIDCETDVCSKV